MGRFPVSPNHGSIPEGGSARFLVTEVGTPFPALNGHESTSAEIWRCCMATSWSAAATWWGDADSSSAVLFGLGDVEIHGQDDKPAKSGIDMCWEAFNMERELQIIEHMKRDNKGKIWMHC